MFKNLKNSLSSSSFVFLLLLFIVFSMHISNSYIYNIYPFGLDIFNSFIICFILSRILKGLYSLLLWLKHHSWEPVINYWHLSCFIRQFSCLLLLILTGLCYYKYRIFQNSKRVYILFLTFEVKTRRKNFMTQKLVVLYVSQESLAGLSV